MQQLLTDKTILENKLNFNSRKREKVFITPYQLMFKCCLERCQKNKPKYDVLLECENIIEKNFNVSYMIKKNFETIFLKKHVFNTQKLSFFRYNLKSINFSNIDRNDLVKKLMIITTSDSGSA